MIDTHKQENFVFGVFSEGKIVFLLNRITCNHIQADFIVRILNLAKQSLMTTHYFAYDYTREI